MTQAVIFSGSVPGSVVTSVKFVTSIAMSRIGPPVRKSGRILPSAGGTAAFEARSGDRQAGDTGARRAGRGAALPADGHGDRRPSGDDGAGRAGACGNGAVGTRYAVQLPDLRDDRAGRAAVRGGGGRGGR